ncbi:MAG TPA: DUF3108 domain-containing protein [Ramlibacter sp.]|nr:DUF3108 domain-containing protein [Ramlibacter sp.]
MSAAGRSWRPLAALACAVIALHLAALDGLGHWRLAPGEATQAGRAQPLRLRRVADAALDRPPTDARPALARPAPLRPFMTSDATRMPTPQATSRPSSQAQAPAPLASVPPASPPQARAAPGPASTEGAPTETVAAPAQVAPSMRLRYLRTARLQGIAVTGEAELALRHDGARYEASLRWSGPARLARSQHSAGAITPHGLAPLRHAQRIRSEEAAHFDAANARVVFSGGAAPADLAPGAQDRLSVLWQLGALMAADPALQHEGVVIALQVATTRDADVWRFVVRGAERLALPGGEVIALRLVRQARGEFDPQMELWLAPGQDYAPVRLRLTQPHGDWVEQQWSATDRH